MNELEPILLLCIFHSRTIYSVGPFYRKQAFTNRKRDLLRHDSRTVKINNELRPLFVSSSLCIIKGPLGPAVVVVQMSKWCKRKNTATVYFFKSIWIRHIENLLPLDSIYVRLKQDPIKITYTALREMTRRHISQSNMIASSTN